MRNKVLAGALLLSMLFIGCNLGEDPEGKHYISLRVDSVLTEYDAVTITLIAPEGDTLDTLWRGPLGDVAKLLKVETEKYKGGKVDILIVAMDGNRIVYIRILHFTAPGEDMVSESPPLPDYQPPVIKLGGADSLDLKRGEAFRDTVSCEDDRDKNPDLVVSGEVNPDSIGVFTLSYACKDSSGNEAERKRRVVRVYLPADDTPPVLKLRGQDSLRVVVGTVYADSGADCQDDRDGTLSVWTTGQVKTSALGSYEVTLTCADKAGNSASAVRKVQVIEVFAPILSVEGPEVITLAKGQAFADPKAECVDDRDGQRPVTASGTVSTGKVGVYLRAYACSDLSGNVSKAVRQFAVEEPSAVLPAVKEASFDTNYRFVFNNGSDPIVGFSRYSGDDWITALQFDHARVNRAGLTSAKAVFNTFGMDSEDWNGGEITVTFRVNRINHAWTEGFGNWYYHRDAWANGGQAFFINHVMRPEILQNSLDPAQAPGVSRNDKALFRPEAVTPIGQPQVITLDYSLAQSAQPGKRPMPAAENLVQVEIDLTEYIKTSPILGDHGLLITASGLGTRGIRYATKEIGDGSLGPKLVLSYQPTTDSVPPALTLRGPDSLDHARAVAYKDSGATCSDDRDGTLGVTVTDSVLIYVVGRYTVTYTCQDLAGNRTVKRRVVRVVDPADVTPPTLILEGPALVTLARGQAFTEPPLSCVDPRDGQRPIATQGTVNMAKVGVYLRLYSCSDLSGNASYGRREFAVEEPGAILPAVKEASLDTNYRFVFNNGGDPIMGISKRSGDDWISVMQFDLARVDKGGLASAKVVFNSFGLGAWEGDSVQVTFRVNRVASAWVEGNGNWYYHDGGWANGGQAFFANHPMRPEILSTSRNPNGAEGVSAADKAIFRAESLVEVGAPQTRTLRFTAAQSGAPNGAPMPSAANLVPLEIDLTEYVKTSTSADHGLLITVDGLGGKGFRLATKELGDGSLGPKLVLGYGAPSADTALPAEKETLIDTLDTGRNPNNGYSPAIGLARDAGDNYLSLVAFDLAKVNKSGLLSARIRFRTYLRAPDGNLNLGRRSFTFKIHTVGSDWVEGTGNWYYHDGGYRNHGATVLANHGLTPEALANSANPVPPNGIAASGRALVRRQNVTLIKTVTTELNYPLGVVGDGAVPPSADLVDLLLDVTDYVKSVDPAKDYGFFITVAGSIGGGEWVSFLTKEAGPDGRNGPKLLLSYGP